MGVGPKTWARGEPDAWERARPVRRCGPGKRTLRKKHTAPRPDPYLTIALRADGREAASSSAARADLMRPDPLPGEGPGPRWRTVVGGWRPPATRRSRVATLSP